MALRIVIACLVLSNMPGLFAYNRSQEIEQQLYLLVLLPYPNDNGNPSWSGGPNVIPAMRLAVNDVRSSGVLYGLNLTLLEKDCGCNYTNRARINFIRSVLYSQKQIVGLIGPGCSASAVAIAPLTTQGNISLINIHGAGTPKLGDHSRYKNLFGIYGSSNGIAAAMIAMIEDRGWTNVAVLYDSTRIFQSSTHDAFIEQLTTSNISVNVTSAALSHSFYHLEKLREKLIRIVILLAGPMLARNLLCTAFMMNMTYPVIQWIVIERSLTEFKQDVDFDYRGFTYSCSKEIMVSQVLNGSVLITYRLANVNDSTGSSNNSVLSYKEFSRKYNSEIERINMGNGDQTINYSPWGSMYYDAVWAIAFALNKSQHSHADFDMHTYGRNGYRSKSDTSILRQAMKELDFQGVSGRISFNKLSGYNHRSFNISLVVNSTILLIAHYDDFINHFIRVDLLDETFPEQVHLTNIYATISLGLISFLILTATVIFHSLSIYYRNDYFVRAASVRLNQTAIVGCYLLLFASFIAILVEGIRIIDNVKALLCHTIHFLCSIGFTLLFGATCARAWRLFRIFNYVWKEPGGCLSDKLLLILVVLATTVDIFLNILWVIIDPFEIRVDQSDFDGFYRIIEKRCHAEHFTVWYLTIYLYNFIFAIIACLLTSFTTKIYISGFQTKVVAKFTYAVFLSMGFAISLQVILRIDRNLDHIVIFIADFCSLNIAVALSVYYLFMPPVYPRLKDVLSKHSCI